MCAVVCVVMCVHKYVVSYWLPESIRLCRHGLIRQGEESEQEEKGDEGHRNGKREEGKMRKIKRQARLKGTTCLRG